MTYQQPGQYPSYPQYPGSQYPGAPPTPAKPPIPSTVQNAFYLMVTGAVLSVVSGVLTISETSTLRSQVRTHNPDFTSTQVDRAVNVIIGSAVVGILIGVGLWLWMAFANRAGKNYARITGTVFFGISTLFTIGALAASPGSSMSGAKANALGVVISVLSWLVGLVTVVLLWNSRSGPYFKPEQAYGYGYPPPAQYPYPQQPPQGQQQSPYPTPPQMQPPDDPWSTNPPR